MNTVVTFSGYGVVGPVLSECALVGPSIRVQT